MTNAVEFIFPTERTCPFSPPEQYAEMREHAPISRVRLPTGQEVWALTRYEDIRTMLSDPRFSSDRLDPGFPKLRELPNSDARFRKSLINMDPPDHGPARRAVVGEFTVRRMELLRPRIQEIVDEHIDAMLAGPKPVDLVRALSLPVPSLVICELLGVPYADHEFFQVRSSTLLRVTATGEEIKAAADELRDYLDRLVLAKEEDPGDDLIGRQIVKQRETDTEDHDGLVALAFLLLVAGHETTANMISLSAVALLEHPDQLTAIRTDPTKTASAVEEMLRVFTIAEFAASRVARQDVEIGGVLIHAGEGVLALANAANHDLAQFADPDAIDVDRGARHHISFGYGAHQCLGQNLARMELAIVLDTLFAKIPTLRLAAPVDELRFKDDGAIYGIYELPVTW